MSATTEACCATGICTIRENLIGTKWASEVMNVMVKRGIQHVYETGQSGVDELTAHLSGQEINLSHVVLNRNEGADPVTFYDGNPVSEIAPGVTGESLARAVATCLNVSRQEGDGVGVVPCQTLEVV